MAAPPLSSWDVGVNPTSAILNARIRDAINFMKNRPHAVLRRITSNQAVSSNTNTPIFWNGEDLDTDGGHSNVTNPSRYTVATAGYYQLSAVVVWGTNSNGYRQIFFAKNGVTTSRYGMIYTFVRGIGGAQICMSTSVVLGLQAGDYVEVWGYQNTGGSLDVSVSNQDSRFEIEWVSNL
ncbi:hypothetical protein [Streptomyces sp.]|uniref:hypothetical protein n=1 Tax=Streptomyces sp. TaxID=1931 RepID=UPI002F93DF57